MPSLKLFGRRTPLSGDDLRSYLIVHALYKGLQFALACSLICVTIRDNQSDEINDLQDARNCSSEDEKSDKITFIYTVSSIVVHTICISLLGPCFYYAGMGTPTDQLPRKPLIGLLYFDMICLNFLQCILFGIGVVEIQHMISYCVCIGGTLRSCPLQVDTTILLSILFLTHAFDFTKSIMTLLYFTCCHDRLFTNNDIEFVSSERKCSIYLRCCVGCASVFTCCLFGGDQALRGGDYAHFSLLFANFVNGSDVLDVTPSDISAGLSILRLVRKQKILETTTRLNEYSTTSGEYSGSQRESFSTKIPKNEEKDGNKVTVEISSNGNSVDILHTLPLSTVNVSEEMITEGNNGNRTSVRKASENEQRSEILSKIYPEDINIINEGAHFMLYAQAAYTVVAYMLENPVFGLAHLVSEIILNWCGCSLPQQKESIEGDSIFLPQYIQYITFRAVSQLKDKDIIYASFIDNIIEIPYMIILDHEWKSVVVTIRGTITLESILTDMNVVPKELTHLGDECGFDGRGLYCHSGILSSTAWLYRELERHGKLTKVLKEYENYKLRITGHSLGAGVAAILSVLLRSNYPNLRCHCFSPPGCVMNESLADDVAEFTTSYIINDDIIARTSIEGFEELRDSILEMICRIKIPKHEVSKVIKDCDETTIEGLSKAINHILYEKDEIKNSKFKHGIDQFKKVQKEQKEKNAENYIKLCPPGRLIQFFLKVNVDQSDQSFDQYTARYANRQDFETINISSHLLSDHSTLGVKVKLREFAQQKFGLRHPFPPFPSDSTAYNINEPSGA